MLNYVKKPAFVTFKSWFIAIMLNTIAGTLYLNADSGMSPELLFLLFIGFIFSALFSFPAFFLLGILFYKCISKRYTLIKTAWIIYPSAMVLGSLCFYAFLLFSGPPNKTSVILFLFALSSGLVSITAQYSAAKKLILSFYQAINLPENFGQ